MGSFFPSPCSTLSVWRPGLPGHGHPYRGVSGLSGGMSHRTSTSCPGMSGLSGLEHGPHEITILSNDFLLLQRLRSPDKSLLLRCLGDLVREHFCIALLAP